MLRSVRSGGKPAGRRAGGSSPCGCISCGFSAFSAFENVRSRARMPPKKRPRTTGSAEPSAEAAPAAPALPALHPGPPRRPCWTGRPARPWRGLALLQPAPPRRRRHRRSCGRGRLRARAAARCSAPLHGQAAGCSAHPLPHLARCGAAAARGAQRQPVAPRGGTAGRTSRAFFCQLCATLYPRPTFSTASRKCLQMMLVGRFLFSAACFSAGGRRMCKAQSEVGLPQAATACNRSHPQ